MARSLLGAFLAALVLAGCAAGDPKVRVTLNDGQVLVGTLATRSFDLKTGFGTLSFDTAHAGELGPAEGEDLEVSGDAVRLWLRNGSEFVGKWVKPSVTVVLSVGDREVEIAAPIAKVRRLQFFGRTAWPGTVFRIVTVAGDDFFVDVTRTRVPLKNELGAFEPFLSEIADLSPLDRTKNLWRVAFENGTVLNAEIARPSLELELDMGPEAFLLPLESVAKMERRVLERPESPGRWRHRTGLTAAEQAEEDAAPAGYYSNAEQKAVKSQSWKD